MFANTTSIDEQLTSFSTAASTLPYPMRTTCEEDEESIKNAVGLAALRLAALNDRCLSKRGQARHFAITQYMTISTSNSSQNLAPSLPRHDGAQSIEKRTRPQSRLEILAELRDQRAFRRLGRAANLTLIHEPVIQIKHEICDTKEHG